MSARNRAHPCEDIDLSGKFRVRHLWAPGGLTIFDVRAVLGNEEAPG